MAKASIGDLLNRTWQVRGEGDEKLARALLLEAEAICASNDFLSLGRIQHIYMQLEADRDHLEAAIPYCQQAISYYEQAQNSDRIAHATRHLADLLRAVGNHEEARLHYEAGIQRYEASSDVYVGDLANAYRGYALTLEILGDTISCEQAWRRTHELYDKGHCKEGVDEAEKHLQELI